MSSHTKIVGIIAVVCFCVASAVLAFMVYEVSASGVELKERVALIANKNAQMKVYTELSILMQTTQEERAEVASYVLTEAETSTFLTDIESLGAPLGVELITTSLDVVKKDASFDELAIEFAIEGSEEAVRNMLVVFETLPYHSSVAALSLAQETNGKVRGTIELTVSLRNYE